MKTAMQELKSDLVSAIHTGNKALEEINDLQTREACQAVVKITIDNILNRIDTELLYLEKEQMIEFAKYTEFIDTDKSDMNKVIDFYLTLDGEEFVEETFKSE